MDPSTDHLSVLLPSSSSASLRSSSEPSESTSERLKSGSLVPDMDRPALQGPSMNGLPIS